MAKWQTPDPALVQAFDAALPLAGVERRKMFGCPAAFVNGNMFAAIHEQRLVVRVPSEAAARPFAPMGRAMKEYAAIDDALDCEPHAFRDWIARGLAYAKTLPAKEAPKRPARKTTTAKGKK